MSVGGCGGLDRSGEVSVWPHFHDELPLSLVHLKSRRDDPVILALREAAMANWAEEKRPEAERGMVPTCHHRPVPRALVARHQL